MKKIKGKPLEKEFTEKHYTKGSKEAYEYVVQGMRASVLGGTCHAANTPMYEVCGKTGTAQNRGRDHSAFMGFAPMNSPKIAIAVYVENGGFGAVYGVPIGSLMIEQYLNGKLSEASEERATAMQNRHIDYGFNRKISRADSLRVDSIKKINDRIDSLKRVKEMKEKEMKRKNVNEDEENESRRKANEEKKRQSEQPIIRMDDEVTIMKERRKKGEDKSSDNGNKENTDKQGVNGKRDTDR